MCKLNWLCVLYWLCIFQIFLHYVTFNSYNAALINRSFYYNESFFLMVSQEIFAYSKDTKVLDLFWTFYFTFHSYIYNPPGICHLMMLDQSIFSYVDMWLTQQHLSFMYFSEISCRSCIKCQHIWGSVSELCSAVLFHWSICLCLSQYQTVDL